MLDLRCFSAPAGRRGDKQNKTKIHFFLPKCKKNSFFCLLSEFSQTVKGEQKEKVLLFSVFVQTKLRLTASVFWGLYINISIVFI